VKLRFPLTVFYDASCPLCASEMHALKARDADGKLELVDCSAPDFDEGILSGTTVKRSHLMTYLHARDAHGRWLIGVDAFQEIYGAVGLQRLAGLWPRLRRLYPWIARNRQRLSRLLYCSSGQCSSRTRPTTVKRESPSGRTTAISPSAR